MIADVEQALLARIRQVLGNTVREVASHPGHWDDEAVRLVTRTPPAVYVAWLGLKEGRFDGEVVSRWALFVAARVLNAQRGDQVGTYQITEQLIAGLQGQSLAPGGLFRLAEVRNLWRETQSNSGVAIYGLYFESPGMVDALVGNEPEALPDFERHYQTWAPEQAGVPVLEAHIHLQTAEEPSHE